MFKKLIYLLIFSGFFGSAFLSLKLTEGLTIFPYRIILLLIIYLFLISFFFKKGKLNVSEIKVKNYIAFLILWIAYAIISLSWAIDKGSAVRDIIFLFSNILVILFVVYYFKNLKDFKRFYNLWLLVLLLLMAIGLWNQITGQQIIDYSSLNIPDYKKESFMHTPRAIFYNQNDYATYLALSIPFVITFIRYAKNTMLKFSGMLIISVCLYLLVFTFSRANYVAVLFGFVFWYMFLTKKSLTKIKIAIFVSLIILILSIFLFNYIEIIGDIIKVQLISLSQESGIGNSLSIRVNLIKNSLLFFFNSFGLGIGAGNSEYYMVNYATYPTYGITNVHNWWLEILGEYGIFIFTGYILFYIGLFANLYKVYKKLDTVIEKKICESLLMSLAVFSFASISSSSILNFMPQWILFAFSLGFLNYYRIQRGEHL